MEQARRFRPEIIISDIKMPRRNGLEMAAAVREFFARVPVHFSERLFRQGIPEGRHPAEGRLLCRKAAGSERDHCRAAGGNGGAAAPCAAHGGGAVFPRRAFPGKAYEPQTVFSCGKSALSQLEKLIREQPRRGNARRAGRMYAEISRCEGTSPEYLRHLYCQIIFLFLHAAESHNVRAVTERTDFLLYTAVRQETLAGLWDILRRTAQDYFSALNPSCPDIAVRVENYIEAHYRNCGLTVQSIAGELGFTNSYLCAAYKKSCGKTVNQRLTEIRLHHAKELLAGTSRRLYEIANAVGYGDGKYFVKLFTREVGLSPREYRGRHSYEE